MVPSTWNTFSSALFLTNIYSTSSLRIFSTGDFPDAPVYPVPLTTVNHRHFFLLPAVFLQSTDYKLELYTYLYNICPSHQAIAPRSRDCSILFTIVHSVYLSNKLENINVFLPCITVYTTFSLAGLRYTTACCKWRGDIKVITLGMEREFKS